MTSCPSMRLWQVCIFLAACAAIAFVVGDAPRPHAASQRQATWSEMRWPFPIDQWGTGRAFFCRASECGTDVQVYVRPKIGFCNCAEGVADDADIDRVADVELISGQYVGEGSGKAADVANLKGRIRWYRITAGPEGRLALTVAFSKKCDVMVATAVAAPGSIRPSEPAILEFLNGGTVTHWAERDLGV